MGQAHGQRDFVLPFVGSGWLKDLLEAQGRMGDLCGLLPCAASTCEFPNRRAGLVVDGMLRNLKSATETVHAPSTTLADVWCPGVAVEYHPHGGSHDLGGSLQLQALSKFLAKSVK